MSTENIQQPASVNEAESKAGFAATHGSATVIIYAGKHYGRRHDVLLDTGTLITAIHTASGDVITAHHSDCERESPNE